MKNQDQKNTDVEIENEMEGTPDMKKDENKNSHGQHQNHPNSGHKADDGQDKSPDHKPSK